MSERSSGPCLRTPFSPGETRPWWPTTASGMLWVTMAVSGRTRGWGRGTLLLLTLVQLLALGACGAGAITGALLGSRRGGNPTTTVSLTVSPAAGPIVVASGEFVPRTAVLRGRSIPTGAALEMRLSWNDGGTVVEDVQILGAIDVRGSEVTIDVALTTTNIAARAGDPRTRDLDVEMSAVAVMPDATREVLATTGYRLLRQPALALVPNRPDLGITLVPVSGGEIQLNVDDLPTIDVRDLAVEIVTLDPNPPAGSDPRDPPVIRSPGANLTAVPVPGQPNRTRITLTAPPATVAIAVFVQVRHAQAGFSNAIGDVYYQPELTAVVPRRASTTGRDLLTLTGRALIPLDFSVSPPRPDISLVQLQIVKGNQLLPVPTENLRPALSTVNSIVFVAPGSPDGRPGPATARLVTRLPLPIATDGEGLLAYGAALADLGPRGVSLSQDIVAAGFGRLDVASADASVDAAVLFADASGVPFVQVFEARGNGMFTALGVEALAGDRADVDQRDPLDLVWSDFGGDGLGDIFVLNGGSTRSTHTQLRGTGVPGQPVVLAGVAFRTQARPALALGASFDGNTLGDLLVVGTAQADRTTETARALLAGGFQTQRVFTQSVPLVERATIADFDGDGAQDLAFASGGITARLRLAFGDGLGEFPDRRTIDLSAQPGLVTASVVEVLAVGPGPDRAVALVVRDLDGSAHELLTITASAPRTYDGATSSLALPASAPSAALAADLDGDDVHELVVAILGAAPLLFVWQSGAFVELPGAVNFDASDAEDIFALRFGQAVGGSRGPRSAVFVAHRGGALRSDPARITTLFVGPGPTLEDARAQRLLRAPARRLLTWASGSGSAASDAVIAYDDELALLANDGIGGFTEQRNLALGGLVEDSLCACSSGAGDADRLVFLLADGRVGILDVGAALPVFSSRPLMEGLGTVRAGSRIRSADVDADGFGDLVVLIEVERTGGEHERQLILLRGSSGGAAPFPYDIPEPSAWTGFGSVVTDIAIGDFAPNDPDGRAEVVLAVPRIDPERGLHFFRYDQGTVPNTWSLVASIVDPSDPRAASTIDPRLVRVSDLDADGFDDLLIASGTLDVLQVLRQTGVSTRTTAHPEEVDPFVFARTSDLALPAGEPVALHLADLDGDLVDDLVVQVRRRFNPEQHAIAVAISDALAGFGRRFDVASVDVGDSGPDLSTAIGDLNGDAIPDLGLAWSGDGGAVPSSLRALFGTHR